jgi:hypothetical protein
MIKIQRRKETWIVTLSTSESLALDEVKARLKAHASSREAAIELALLQTKQLIAMINNLQTTLGKMAKS